jgi:cytidylate kinase
VARPPTHTPAPVAANEHKTFVTVSASFGAGGSAIGPALARRLDVPFYDRAIPAEVARRLAVPLEAAIAQEESRSGPIGRLLASFVPLGVLYGAAGLIADADVVDEGDYRAEADRVILELASRPEGGVLLGRAGAVVLRGDPCAVHVRLDGPPERRLARARARAGLDAQRARASLRESDAAREAYVRQLYGVDPRDPALYHLTVDSTCLSEDDCVQLITSAVLAVRRGGDTPEVR